MITLASDFGSPYPAAMKGVLLRHTDARLVDVSQELPRQDVRAAAFWLRETLPYFPPAVHLVVVDPGVGTDRAALVCRAGEHLLVAPDNGVLRPVARVLARTTGGGSGDASAQPQFFRVDESRFRPTPDGPAPFDRGQSSTFHGRDVFAPVAGVVHDVGVDSLLGEGRLTRPDSVVDLELPTATVESDVAVGEVLVVDDFGNVVTNVPGSFLEGHERVAVGDETVPVGETFASVGPGEALATVGSHGFVELDVNRGRGDDRFGLAPRDAVRLEAA
jgi:S-adenosylmethionine hydrolase